MFCASCDNQMFNQLKPLNMARKHLVDSKALKIALEFILKTTNLSKQAVKTICILDDKTINRILGSKPVQPSTFMRYGEALVGFISKSAFFDGEINELEMSILADITLATYGYKTLEERQQEYEKELKKQKLKDFLGR